MSDMREFAFSYLSRGYINCNCYEIQLITNNVDETPNHLSPHGSAAPLSAPSASLWAQNKHRIAVFSILITPFIVCLIIIEPLSSCRAGLQLVLIRIVDCNEENICGSECRAHIDAHTPLSTVCVCVRHYASAYGGAGIFKAAGHLQAGGTLSIFSPRTRRRSRCKSLSAESQMDCTKADLPCMHSCMHTHRHTFGTHTNGRRPSVFSVRNRNGFSSRMYRHAMRGKCPPQIDFFLPRNDDPVTERRRVTKWVHLLQDSFYIFAF